MEQAVVNREKDSTTDPTEESAAQTGGVAGGSQGTDGIGGGDDHGRKVRSGGSGSPGGRPRDDHGTEEEPPRR